jgi:hypothetical protein
MWFFKHSVFFVTPHCVCITYCHEFMALWPITTDSGLDDWIYWCLLLQPLLISINYNSSQSMTACDSLHCLLDYECLLSSLSSTVTDLVLIYQLVTSSASVVRRLTLHRWTMNPTQLLNFWTLLRLHHDDWINYVSSLYNFRANWIQITTLNGSSIILCLSTAAETCVNSVATLWFLQTYPFPRKHA